jgi:hypothetical protein
MILFIWLAIIGAFVGGLFYGRELSRRDCNGKQVGQSSKFKTL